MTIKFTARTVDSLQPTSGKRVEYFDVTVPGLALRVTETGHKSWSVHYRTHEGRLRRLTLGRYPALSLAKARKGAQKAIRDAALGKDPAGEKRAVRQGESVGDLAKDYLEKYAKKRKRSWRDDDRMLTAEVLPTWRQRKVKELTRRDVRTLVEAIAERGSPITANRCLALVRKMLNFAIEKDWIEANVASLIEKPGGDEKDRQRERVLSDDEIRLVWAACEGERPVMCALTRLRLLTAQRGGELAGCRWADLEGDWLTIPGTVSKNKRAHRVPLSAPARTILDAVPRIEGCDFIFAGRGGNRPLGDAKKASPRIAARVLAELRKRDATIKTFDFRGHDLRRTASTKMAEAGISQADIAKVLNHAEGGPRATQVYNRYAYDREKQIALDTWARTLTAILKEKRAGKVLPITKGA